MCRLAAVPLVVAGHGEALCGERAAEPVGDPVTVDAQSGDEQERLAVAPFDEPVEGESHRAVPGVPHGTPQFTEGRGHGSSFTAISVRQF